MATARRRRLRTRDGEAVSELAAGECCLRQAARERGIGAAPGGTPPAGGGGCATQGLASEQGDARRVVLS